MNEPVIEAPQQPAPEKPKKSILGILSFLIGFIWIFECVILIILDPFAYLWTKPVSVFGITALTGLFLGIIGIIQKNRIKGFAIAGTVMNAIFLCVVLGITIIMLFMVTG
jgi:hypothetical protein